MAGVGVGVQPRCPRNTVGNRDPRWQSLKARDSRFESWAPHQWGACLTGKGTCLINKHSEKSSATVAANTGGNSDYANHSR